MDGDKRHSIAALSEERRRRQFPSVQLEDLAQRLRGVYPTSVLAWRLRLPIHGVDSSAPRLWSNCSKSSAETMLSLRDPFRWLQRATD